MAIDIGPGATNRASSISGGGYTDIMANNPANANGSLTSVEIWAATNLSNCEIGTFYTSDSVTFVCRDSCVIGSVTAGSKQTFTQDASTDPIAITVQVGDYLGIYYTAGTMERDSSGYSGLYWNNSRLMDPLDSGSYNFLSGNTVSIYATGTEGAWVNIAKANGVAAASISKLKGIAVGSIAKICGVEV